MVLEILSIEKKDFVINCNKNKKLFADKCAIIF